MAAMAIDTTPVPSQAPDAEELQDADDGLDAPLSLPKRLAPSPLEARLAGAVLRPPRPPSPPPPPLLADETWFDSEGVATCSLDEVPQLPAKQLEACLRHMREDEVDSAMLVVFGQPPFAMKEHAAASACLLKALRERVKLSDIKVANFLHQLADAMGTSTPVGACARAARTLLFRSLSPAAAVKFAAAQSAALGKPVIRVDTLNALALSVGKTAAAFRVPAYTVLSLQLALQKRSRHDHVDAQRVAWAMLDALTPCARALSMHGSGVSSMESLVDCMLQSWSASMTQDNGRIIERLVECFGVTAVAAMSAIAPLPRFALPTSQQPPPAQLPRPPAVPPPAHGLLVQPPPAPRVFMSPAPRHVLPPNKRYRVVAPAPMPFSPDMFFAEDDEAAQPAPVGLPVQPQPQHKRTSKGLTAEERARLEAATAADHGQMTKERRAEVAAEVGLTPKQVMGWWGAVSTLPATVRLRQQRQQRRTTRPGSDDDYEPAEKQPAAPLVPTPAARVAEPLDAVQRRLLAKAAARAAAVTDAAAALAARAAAPQAAPEPLHQPPIAAAEPPAAEPSVTASEVHVDAPAPPPPPAAMPPPAQFTFLPPLAMRPVTDAPAQAPPAPAATTSLPRGITIPAFARLPPADVAPDASEAVVHAMLVELGACGWIGPGRLEESAAVRLREWRLPCDAAVGLRSFMDEVLVRTPTLQFKTHLWSGVAVNLAISASEARMRTARAGSNRPAPPTDRGRSRSPERGPSTAALTFALPPPSAGHSLPHGVAVPAFAYVQEPDLRPDLVVPLLEDMLGQLTACGWAASGRIDALAMQRMRSWHPPVDAVVGLRTFMQDLLNNDTFLQRLPEKWSGIVISRARRASEARRAAVGAAEAGGARAMGAGRSRSRSRSRERSPRRGPDAPPSFVLPPASARHNLPHGVTVPAFVGQPLPKLTPDVAFFLLGDMLDQLTACGWAGHGPRMGLDAEAMKKLRSWNTPSDAVVGLRALLEDILERRPPLQKQPEKWSGMAITSARLASEARRAASGAAAGGVRVAEAGRSRSRERKRRSQSKDRKRRSRSRSRDRKRRSDGRDERRRRSSRSRSRGRVRSRSRSRKRSRSRERSRRAVEAPPHAAPPPPPPAPPAPMPPMPPAAPPAPAAVPAAASAVSAPAARRKAPRYVCRDPTTNELWKPVKLSTYRAAVESGTISADKAATTLFWLEGADESTGVPLTTLLAQNPA